MRCIGEPLTAEESAALIAACRSQMGKPFGHMKRGPRQFDCAGLLLWAMASIGRPVNDIAVYGREPHKDGLRENMIFNLGPPVPKESMRAGDMVLMRFDGEPRHVGLLTDHPAGGLALIHTHAHIKRVSEHRLDAYWAGCITEVWRP